MIIRQKVDICDELISGDIIFVDEYLGWTSIYSSVELKFITVRFDVLDLSRIYETISLRQLLRFRHSLKNVKVSPPTGYANGKDLFYKMVSEALDCINSVERNL